MNLFLTPIWNDSHNFGDFKGRVQHVAFSHNRLCKCLERIGRKLKTRLPHVTYTTRNPATAGQLKWLTPKFRWRQCEHTRDFERRLCLVSLNDFEKRLVYKPVLYCELDKKKLKKKKREEYWLLEANFMKKLKGLINI